MRAQIPVVTGFEWLISEAVDASVPSRLAPDDASRGRPALAHGLQFPLGELHELASEEPAHAGGHVDVLADADDLLAVDLAELVIEGDEIQVVPESPVKLVDDENIHVIRGEERQPLADLGALPDRFAARDVEVFGLGYDDVILALAECFDCLGLGHQVSSGLGEMRQPLCDDRPELLLFAHRPIIPSVLY